MRLDYTFNRSDKLILVDKVLGKVAMLLAVRIGITRVLTPVMSQEAVKVAKLYDIDYEASKTVPYITNRQGDGKCPLEISVGDTENLDSALINIQKVVEELMKNNL